MNFMMISNEQLEVLDWQMLSCSVEYRGRLKHLEGEVQELMSEISQAMEQERTSASNAAHETTTSDAAPPSGRPRYITIPPPAANSHISPVRHGPGIAYSAIPPR
jgi:hypothetical protein